MNLRTQIACCVFGALIAGIVAVHSVIVLVSGITSRDWKTLKLEPVIKEAKVQALRGKPVGELIIRLDADAQSYSKQMVIVTTKLAELLNKQAVTALVGGGVCFLLFSYVGFTLWKRREAT